MGYALIIVVIFHARVILYEEKEMQRLFGREWDAYRRAVPRWGLRFLPYAPNVERGAAPNGGSAGAYRQFETQGGPPTMKSSAPFRCDLSVFALTPCRGASPSDLRDC